VRLHEHKVLVQIGTYNGADEFNGYVRYSHPKKVILVEPNEEMNETILANYDGISNIFIENSAITEVTKGIVTLKHPADIPRKNRQFYNECFSLIPMDDWGNDFKTLDVSSLSFMDLCKKYSLTDIHFLQIDAEGYDCEIIKSIDFHKVNIDIIKYENWSFPTSCFTRYGKKGQQYGEAGMEYVACLLRGYGYELEEGKADIIASKIKLDGR
jgi:FkbM family methyltransferase